MRHSPVIQELAIALGNDPEKNYRRRELPWYALWNTVLRQFERFDSCCLSPQYPLWLLALDDETESSSSGSQPDYEMTSDPSDDADAIGFQHVLGRSEAYSDSDSMSFSPPSSPLAHKSKPISPLLPTPSPPKPPPPKPLPPMSKDEPHKVTDFAILHLRNTYNQLTHERQILDILVPVIIEIKTYRRWNNNDDDDASIDSRWQGLKQAQRAVNIQVRYFFSGRQQSSVIAIAAAGPFWTWRQYFKAEESPPFANFDDGDYVPSDDVLDLTRNMVWSDHFRIGNENSNVMLDKIEAWVKEFIDPFTSGVLVLERED